MRETEEAAINVIEAGYGASNLRWPIAINIPRRANEIRVAGRMGNTTRTVDPRGASGRASICRCFRGLFTAKGATKATRGAGCFAATFPRESREHPRALR